jgi:sulfide:quinone oxidoreductase
MVATWAKSIVILGGGPGGLTAANELRLQLAREHQVTLVDKKDQFFMGLAKLRVLTGLKLPWEHAGDLRQLRAKGITFVETQISRLNLSSRIVTTEAGNLPYDYLVVALGADQSPGSVPGFAEAAYDMYTVEGAAALRDRLNTFNEGKLMVMVSSVPFKCPGAPYEAAMLMEEMLRNRGVRDKVDIQIFTPEPHPMSIGGTAIGNQFKSLLTERGIGFNPGCKPKEVDAKKRSVKFENGTSASFDLLAGIPTHVVPRVVKDSILAGPNGWIPVDKKTLQTRVPNVFAVGDVTAVMTANNLPIAKLGTVAEEEAKVVARNIVNHIHGQESRSQFEGIGTCFVEVGGGKACLARGQFLAEPAPKIVIDPPSAEALQQKRDFEAQRLASWF